ncbi:MAG: DUF6273 domain-containing protein [Oscillospiraceae bacterium]|jgi:hypothetical protein|nr:DUF6273 domain-containing protein [Oscillospiraceae bacterium]
MKRLAVLLVAGLALSVTACGGGGDGVYRDEPEPRRTVTSDAAPTEPPALTATVGEIIQFGGYDWRVLDKKDGKALIITDKVIDDRAYNEKQEVVTWETCDLRAYLNGEFYNSFGKADKARVAETQVINNDNPAYGTPGGNDTTDKIFLLSIDEANEYFSDDNARVAYNSEGNASGWWLRSPGSLSIYAANVFLNGSVNVLGNHVFVNGGVRPALWLNLTGEALPTEPPATTQSPTPTPGPPATTQPPASDYETIRFGGYDWRVLDKKDGKALIITDKVIFDRAYNEKQEVVTWETCDLRAYLNGEFYNSFDKKDKAKIVKTKIGNEDNQWYGTPGGNDTDDHIFLLSIEVVVKYFCDGGQLKNGNPDRDWLIDDQYNDDRIACHVGGTYYDNYYEEEYTIDEGEAFGWWLRSPGDVSGRAAAVGDRGYVYVFGHDIIDYDGVRPALWLTL